MNKLTAYFYRILSKFFKPERFCVAASKESSIHPTAKIKDSVITGTVFLEENVKIRNGVKIQAGVKLSIGRFTTVNGPNTALNNQINEIQIGSFCSIARGVDIQEFNHYSSRPSTYFILQNVFGENFADIHSKGKVVLGHDVWVGAQSLILSGVKIGDGAVIAANSVVTSDVPAFSIVGGSPAKVIKMRFNQEIIDRILKDPWWFWSLDKIKKNRAFFSCELTIASFNDLIE